MFPYSPRRYTYAERAYPSWPRSLIMKRAALIRHLSEKSFQGRKKKTNRHDKVGVAFLKKWNNQVLVGITGQCSG